MKTAWLSLFCFVPCLAQHVRLDFTGEISGTLAGDDGTKIAGGNVSLRRLPPQPPRLSQTTWTAVTDAGGAFRFNGLNEGVYQLCAQVSKSVWLNPCEWGPTPPAVVLSAAQDFAPIALVMKKAAVVPIRLDDPGQLLAQSEGKTSAAVVLIGVANDAGWFRVAAVASRDATGKTYQVQVPFNVIVNLSVYSPYFQLADNAGAPLPQTRAALIPISVAMGQAPGTLRLSVTGVVK